MFLSIFPLAPLIAPVFTACGMALQSSAVLRMVRACAVCAVVSPCDRCFRVYSGTWRRSSM